MKYFFALLLLVMNTRQSNGQKIILSEDFKDNRNHWKEETTQFNEKKTIISGRYNIENPTSDRYTASVIPSGFDGGRNFVIESVITELPKEKEYQKIYTEAAMKLLPQMNYANKDYKLIAAGINIIHQQQERAYVII